MHMLINKVTFILKYNTCRSFPWDLINMSVSKRPRTHDENAFKFIDASTVVQKCVRWTIQPVSLAEIQNLQRARAEKELEDAEAKRELDERVADEKKREDAKARVEQHHHCWLW
jgi:hypothetical protein